MTLFKNDKDFLSKQNLAVTTLVRNLFLPITHSVFHSARSDVVNAITLFAASLIRDLNPVDQSTYHWLNQCQ